jgi:polyisoprenoid-binding protein YceI
MVLSLREQATYPEEETTMSTQIAPPSTWQVDKLHSTADFAVRHMVVSTFRGTFNELDATLQIDENGEVSLSGVVPVASVDVADEQLKGHLQSPDFFDAERYPEIRFVSTAVRRGEDDAITVEGDLTIKGHTEHLTAEGTLRYVEADLGGGERYGVELEVIVDRTRFGLNWNAPLPKGGFALANDVKLDVHLEFVPAS